MAASRVSSPSDGFDKRNFLNCMHNLGRAYRNQAMELIRICRVFSLCRATEQIFRQDAELSEILQACDDALACAIEAGKDRSSKSDDRIKRVIRRLHDYEKEYYRDLSITDRSDSVMESMSEAMRKDEENSRKWTLSPKPLFFKTQRARAEDASSRIVRFYLLKSVTDTQPTCVPQVLTNDPSLQEILWNFNRYPPASKNRVTLAENPHLYSHHLLPIKSTYANHGRFKTGPMYQYQNVDDINVLRNKPGRVFLDSGGDSRAFDNVWRTNEIFIFKDVCGKLDGESIIGELIQGKPCRWCRVGPQPEVWALVNDWREAILHVLHSQLEDIKIRIKWIT